MEQDRIEEIRQQGIERARKIKEEEELKRSREEEERKRFLDSIDQYRELNFEQVTEGIKKA